MSDTFEQVTAQHENFAVEVAEDVRRASFLGYGACIATAIITIVALPWPGLNTQGAAVCIGLGILASLIVWKLPWQRLPQWAPLSNTIVSLILLGLGVRFTGGWLSPFTTYAVLAVAFAALVTRWEYAIGVGVLAAIVSASPGFYSHAGHLFPTLIASAGVYAVLAYMIGSIMERVRQREQRALQAVMTASQTSKRLRAFEMLQRVSTIVSTYLDTDAAIQAIVRELRDNFGYQLVSVYLREGEDLVMQAQLGYEQWFHTIPMNAGICGRVGSTGVTAFIQDTKSDPDYLAASDDTASEICVPLHIGEAVMGIMNVESPHVLTELDRDILELLGIQVSAVLANASHAKDLRHQAELDPLTGLSNHRNLMEYLDDLLAVAEEPCALIMLDLNNFKSFNDEYGHLAGDDVLRAVAGILRTNSREHDRASRYGGDEFAVILPRTDRLQADSIAARIVTATREYRWQSRDGEPVALDVSAGVAVAPRDGVTRQELIAAADIAMYSVKRARREVAVLQAQ